MRDFLAAARDRVIVFDGGMGATLEQFDLDLERDYKLPGRCHEALVLNRPDVIQGVHESMVEAGAEVVETDTFQGSRIKLDEWGLGDHTLEINRKAAEIARKAVGEDRFVAGSIGPTGYLPASEDPSLGQIRFRDLVKVFAEQAEGLLEGGVDLVIIETAQDILEVKAAIFGVREAFRTTGRRTPIQASVSLLPNGGKMLLGTDISSALATLEALKVDVIGLNCSTGPEDMRDAIRFLGEHSPLPVHCIPNAGIPHQGTGGETVFPERPEPLAEVLGEFVQRYGVSIVGGCCGTTPDHIRAIREHCASQKVSLRPAPRAPHVSSMIAAAPLAQEPAHEPLAAPVAVHVRRVEEGHAGVGGRVQRCHRVVLANLAPVGTELPAAQSHYSDGSSRASQLPFLHGPDPMGCLRRLPLQAGRQGGWSFVRRSSQSRSVRIRTYRRAVTRPCSVKSIRRSLRSCSSHQPVSATDLSASSYVKCSRSWSGTATASRFCPPSVGRPRGSAHERSTPSSSSRRSKWCRGR